MESGSGGGGGKEQRRLSATPTSAPPPQPEVPSSPAVISSRHESQKRRDWNTFLQYLENLKPPLTLSWCSGAHVIDFLRYLDQFGKTKVHIARCRFFRHPDPPAPCACPLRQAWGSLDALIGRLRAAYEENEGTSESNPFEARDVGIYLREVREEQAKARGISYEKKKKRKWSAAAASVSVTAIQAPESGRGGGDVSGNGGGDDPSAPVAATTSNKTTSNEAETNEAKKRKKKKKGAEKRKKKKKGAQLHMSDGTTETELSWSEILLSKDDPQSITSFNMKDIDQLFLEAQHRWLRPAEICEILRNYQKFFISSEPPDRPPSGSLFLFDRKVLRYFRKDGHNWRKKKDGKTVKEAHEKLKVGSVDVLHCYYAHGEENENFQRRSYWMLEQELMHIVLFHYLEVKSNEAETNETEQRKKKKKGAQLHMSESNTEAELSKSEILLSKDDPQSNTSFNMKDTVTSTETKMQNLWKIFDRTTKESKYAGYMEEYGAGQGKSLEKKSQEIESDTADVYGPKHGLYLTSDVEDDQITFDTLVRTRSFVMLAQSHLLLEPADRQSPLLVTEDDIIHLKFIHQSLNDTARECLINFALMCQNQEIETEKLVTGWLLNDLIRSQLEAKEILGTLFNFNLLQSKEDGQVVKLPEVYQYIILDHIIPKNRLFLLQGGKGLTKPPEVEEWEKSKQIYLMDNELSELPENLSCPMLEALFLQRNCKLRMIPPTFFDNMPALQVLNLGRTRIKVLPESLFKLVNLKRLFLNHCDLLISLSNRIGELKCLEVLDLEGTEIMYLPVEVEQLTKLKCLKVSFCEPMNNGRTDRSKQLHDVIPRVIISNLSHLKELNIDVSPDDHRWNENVEDVVPEVCRLAKLHTLKFYFTRVELLSNFKWYGTERESPSLVHFKFIVGRHVKRIMSRIPHDAEFEQERYDKCLRWVNGVGVHREIEKVLGHTNAFFLDRHTGIKKLSEFGFENMVHLESCIVGECNELEAIHDGYQAETRSSDVVVGFPSLKYLCIYYMKNLRSIWEGQLQPTHCGLSFLKYLILRACPQLTTIFTLGLLANLCNLEEMTVDDCPAIISLVSCDDHDNITADFLPNLKKISLHYLPELASISNGLHISPTIEQMSIYYCPTLKSLPINKSLNENLKEIKGEISWWNGLEWEGTEEHSWDDKFVPIDACD